MTKQNLPKLTEAQVRKLATPQSFERGRRYFDGGAIIDPVLQGGELRAECAGSGPDNYEVSVTFDNKGVAGVDCTCPYDYGGACKHAVALLLTFTHRLQSVKRAESLDKTLAGHGKEGLIEIIKEMVKRDRKMLYVIELAAAGPKPGKPINVAAYRTQARRAMQSNSVQVIERELKSLHRIASRLMKAGDIVSAGAVYHAAFDEAVNHYDDVMNSMDYDGDIAGAIEDLAEGLKKCLQNSQADGATRLTWIGTMLESYFTDLDLGGFDLAPSAVEAVLEFANDEEWAWVQDQVHGKLGRSREFERTSLVEFLADGSMRRERFEEASRLIRERGTPEQQAFLLIDEGKIAEALKIVKKIVVHRPGLTTSFADSLLAAGARREALDLVVGEESENWQVRDWLARYYRRYGTREEAIEAQIKVFLGSPGMQAFKTLKEISRKAGNWETVRAGVLQSLESKEQFGTLIEIALDEKDVPRALALLKRVKSSDWFGRNYKSEVAQAAEKEHPQAAIDLYKQLAERSIENRSRGAYQQAVDYLKKAKKLTLRINDAAGWKSYVEELRARFPTLRALQEEINKASL